MREEVREDGRPAAWIEEAGASRRCEGQVVRCPASLTMAGRRYRGEICDVWPLGVLVRLSEASRLAGGDRVTMTPRGYKAVSGAVCHVADDGHRVGLKLLHDADQQAKLTKWLDDQRALSWR